MRNRYIGVNISETICHPLHKQLLAYNGQCYDVVSGTLAGVSSFTYGFMGHLYARKGVACTYIATLGYWYCPARIGGEPIKGMLIK